MDMTYKKIWTTIQIYEGCHVNTTTPPTIRRMERLIHSALMLILWIPLHNKVKLRQSSLSVQGYFTLYTYTSSPMLKIYAAWQKAILHCT